MKTKIAVVAVALSLLNGILSFVVTWSLPIAIGVFLVFALVLIFIVEPILMSYLEKERKRHEAYRFVNGFLISLSVNKSTESAYESALSTSGTELSAVASSIASSSLEERVDYLQGYFVEPYYRMFVSVFRLYEEQGGDPLTLGESLLKEATRSERSADEKRKQGLSKLVEFLSLWVMSGLIIVFVRICLRSFYESLKVNPVYLGCCILYFVLALLSFVLYAVVFTGEKPSLGRRKHA